MLGRIYWDDPVRDAEYYYGTPDEEDYDERYERELEIADMKCDAMRDEVAMGEKN